MEAITGTKVSTKLLERNMDEIEQVRLDDLNTKKTESMIFDSLPIDEHLDTQLYLTIRVVR